MPLNADTRALVAAIDKRYGPGSLIVASEMRQYPPLTTGCVGLDIITGGGLPANQWSEVIGYESSGKTSMVHKMVAANQSLNPDFNVLWVAAEKYDRPYAAKLGVDTGRVLVAPTNAMEEAYQVMVEFSQSQAVDLIVLDSYPALVPDEEAGKEMDEFAVGLGARLTGKFFRKVGKSAAMRERPKSEDKPVTGVIINQWREKIGGFSPQGTPKTTPGGVGKNFAYYLRLEVSRAEFIDEPRPGKGKVRVGQVIKFKTTKNKQAAPQKSCQVDFFFENAQTLGFTAGEFDVSKELLTWGVYYDLINRRGRYFDFGDRTWDSKDAIVQSLRGELDLQDQVRDQLLAAASDEVRNRGLAA